MISPRSPDTLLPAPDQQLGGNIRPSALSDRPNDRGAHIYQDDLQSLESHQLPFRPFFTLVQDVHSSEYYHPTVHYIFSDDDTDLITEAALRVLESGQGNNSLRASSNALLWRRNGEDCDEDEDIEADNTKASSLPPQIPGVQEHYIVLDVQRSHSESNAHPTPEATATNTEDISNFAPTTVAEEPKPNLATSQPINNALQHLYPFNITSAHSLSSSWQVLNIRLCPAPTFDSSSNSPISSKGTAIGTSTTTTTTPTPTTSANHSSSSMGGLMLEIEGTSGVTFNTSSSRSPRTQQSLEEMIEQFEKRMDELRLITEAGAVKGGKAAEATAEEVETG
ncbi:uncharacterized protein PADG_08596 [Paracoccidioides brasiliensis Pb18]|uniref:Uncharacterized protein n=1 Tax=Paracoccidioides brasiliensis (strain Pb18) TaxID=502780 RepID=C1GMV2_PARBD|nr:uncharacterized protein PADG_08596 [Paracoccidioides brasiliensis Pb18]EEH44954.2 hypothetical protein PADG_08596 [Paracoccidioides brasiliensis Pb18]